MRGVKQPRSLRWMAGGVGLMAASLAAGTAQADDAAATVDALTVIGERQTEHPYADPEAPYKTDKSASSKITEPLVDVSKSITVLSEEVIEDTGATSFRDLMRTQPGVTLGTGEGGNAFGDRIFIRGFDARNDVYVDGVRDPGVGSRETFAIEQIEILKGPSSAFGGRGTTGGAVSLISKAPQDGAFGDLEVTLGSDETRRVSLDLNREINDRVAIRVNAMVHESEVAGRDFVFANRWGLAAAVRVQATDDLTLTADYFHLSTDEMPDWGMPYDVAANRPFQVDRDNFYGILARDFRETFADIYTLRADYQFRDGLSLRSVLRYGQSANAYTASAPEQPNAVLRTVRANAKRRDAVTEYLVGQTDVTWDFKTGAADHTLVAGVEFSSEEIVNRGRAFTECATLPCAGTTTNPVQDLDNPDPTRPWSVNDGGIVSRTATSTEGAAAYVLDTVRFGDKWRVFGGLRFDTYDIDLNQVTLATNAVVQRGARSEFWNWHLGVVYKPAPYGSVYLSYGSSSNPSGEQLDSVALDYGGLDPRAVNLDPERNHAWELGAKWDLFDEHLSLTAALFRVDKTNARVALAPGAAAPVSLDGEQRVQGFEVTAAGQITPQWSVFGGLTVLEAEITSSPVPGQAGSKFPNVPETSFSLTSRYQLTDQAHLGATATYNSRRYGGTVTALTTSIPEFWRVDLFGGYQLTEKIEVTFNVLNLTDEVYYDALYRSATPFTYIAPGRSVLISIDYDF
ncbi:MAG TPA: TonB-dependent siderophore receptor [Phenylobacterium sp.]